MGLPPPNYKKDSLLAEPAEKKTVLPVQGGGARVQKGGARPNEKELLIECYDHALKIHYVDGGKLAEPLGEDVKYINKDDDYKEIKEKSIKYAWVNTEKCFDEAAIPILNKVGPLMKGGGTVIFIDYNPALEITPDLIKDLAEEFKKKETVEEPLTHEWDINIIKASDFPFILGVNDGTKDIIPINLVLYTLPGVPEDTEVVAEPQEPTIKLAVGFRVRNPETAKEAIKELSFTPGEELLFKRLGFDKPFIRKYITLPDATKEESDASKDAFFKFWKMYVLMDGTSQFSLMTKGESQKVQQYMRDILDSYRKYLSESALQLLFHTSGKPYEPVSESASSDPFVFTKTVSGKSQDHTKISKAVKELIEAVAAAKGLDFKGHRISIAKAKTLTTVKAAYDSLKSNIAKLVEQAKKAIAASVIASLDTGEALATLTELEGFKFTPGEDSEDFIKAANDLISLATKLINKLDALEKAAREFAIIVEVEVEGEDESNDESYEPSENGDDDSDEDSDDGSDDGSDDSSEEGSEGGDTNNSGSENTRPPPRPKNVELNALKAIFNKKKDGEERILEAFNYLSETFPKPKYLYFKSLMGVIRGSHFDIDHPKIEPSSFFELYLEKKNDNELTFPWILNTLIRIKYKKFKSDELKPVFLDFFKDHIFNAPGGVKYKERVISYIEGK